MEKSLNVRRLGISLRDVSDFTDIDFVIHGKDNVVTHIKREIHILENLSAKALIRIDIAAAEVWMIDLDT